MKIESFVNSDHVAPRRRLAPAVALAVVAALAGLPAGPLAASKETAGDLMTKGKLEADLGHARAAIDAFEAVSRDTSASRSLRGEALVRLGLVRRQSGDHDGSVRAYQQVVASYGDDPEIVRALALAVAGVVPDVERWKLIWKDVRLTIERGKNGQVSTGIAWPGVEASKPSVSYSGAAITLDLEDAALGDVLKRFGDLTGLNIALDPAVTGNVTMRVSGMPWDEALERILEAHGLGYTLSGNQMNVASHKKLAEAAASAGTAAH